MGQLRTSYLSRKLKVENKIRRHYYGEYISRYGPILAPSLSILSLVFRDTSYPEVWEHSS